MDPTITLPSNWGDPRLPERFWDKTVPEPNSGCWLWLGSTDSGGYGQIRVNWRLWPAHRLTYSTLVGPIPEGLDLDHLCRTRSCCNPQHLEPVTRRVNLLRGSTTLNAINAAKTACPRGHLYTHDNTYVRKDRPNCRDCRDCKKERRNEKSQRNTRAGLVGDHETR